MVASGDCFTQGKCLADCQSRAFYQHQTDVKNLKHIIVRLEMKILKLESMIGKSA
jgi:hypothetical protein